LETLTFDLVPPKPPI